MVFQKSNKPTRHYLYFVDFVGLVLLVVLGWLLMKYFFDGETNSLVKFILIENFVCQLSMLIYVNCVYDESVMSCNGNEFELNTLRMDTILSVIFSVVPFGNLAFLCVIIFELSKKIKM